LGPTIASLVLVKIFSLLLPRAKTVTLAVRPSIARPLKFLIPLVRPDLVLSQSSEVDDLFRRYGCETYYLPNGVDMGKFQPVPPEKKRELRRRYGIEEDASLILHIGPLERGRNVHLLTGLQGENRQVLVIGSSAGKADRRTLRDLTQSGCIVWTDYIRSVHEVYQMADCYVFPALDKKSLLWGNVSSAIDLPLTVLEAMATNLFVVSSPFGALPRVFGEGEGFVYARSADEIERTVKTYLAGGTEVRTRERVEHLSWDAISQELAGLYTIRFNNLGRL
ncbi:MAG TPA: glycosyltransferase, partial [Methanomicrobiales archaeon]|nr:glycosyltransferase [Methanomicrobiales archaeon]